MTQPTFQNIQEAAERIAPFVHTTPVLTCSVIDELAGRKVYFKAENLQKVGAFKFRGAINSVLQLTEEERARGVVTHSSGNHAQAVALAAKIQNIPAHIVMPNTAPATKRFAVEGYGAKVTVSGPSTAERESECKKAIEATKGTYISSYNNLNVIAGQGTATLELFKQTNGILEAIVAPVGGGGLLSGTCVAAKGLNPSLHVIGAEPKGADDAYQSLRKGEIVPQISPNTIADGLRTGLGDLTWPIIQTHVSDIVTVTDQEIVRAMFLMWERMKIVVEPSGAVPLAVVLSQQFKKKYGHLRHVGVIISGGNLDLKSWNWDLLNK